MLNGPWLKAQATFYTRSSFSNYSKSREMEKEEWEKRSWMQKLLFSQWGKWGKACAQVKSEHEIFKNHLMQVTTRMSREHILLSEEKQTQRARHCRTPLRQGITQATKPQSLDSVIGP